MFTAYIPPAEEHCCTIALPDGRIGSVSIPDATSVFVIDPTPEGHALHAAGTAAPIFAQGGYPYAR